MGDETLCSLRMPNKTQSIKALRTHSSNPWSEWPTNHEFTLLDNGEKENSMYVFDNGFNAPNSYGFFSLGMMGPIFKHWIQAHVKMGDHSHTWTNT